MPVTDSPNEPSAESKSPELGRRRFLLLIPGAIFAAITGAVGVAALRFLRPVVAAPRETPWLSVGPIAELKGDKPVMRSVTIERQDGWAITFEEQPVFILPKPGNQVLSAVCPHEGCQINWSDETNKFFCPCHDSSFAPDGARVSGPARRGLDPLPSREQEGMLQVQYQTFINNIEERLPRA
jgi:Rieske Fe-S protein